MEGKKKKTEVHEGALTHVHVGSVDVVRVRGVGQRLQHHPVVVVCGGRGVRRDEAQRRAIKRWLRWANPESNFVTVT